jgi:hypothetical protein
LPETPGSHRSESLWCGFSVQEGRDEDWLRRCGRPSALSAHVSGRPKWPPRACSPEAAAGCRPAEGIRQAVGTSRRDYRRRAGSRVGRNHQLALFTRERPHRGGIGVDHLVTGQGGFRPGNPVPTWGRPTRGLWLSLTGALLSENERAIYRTGQLRYARASTVAERQPSVLAGASTLACPNGDQATCRRRRLARANRPPQAAIRPGRPAPTMGPGTAAAEIDESKTFPLMGDVAAPSTPKL